MADGKESKSREVHNDSNKESSEEGPAFPLIPPRNMVPDGWEQLGQLSEWERSVHRKVAEKHPKLSAVLESLEEHKATPSEDDTRGDSVNNLIRDLVYIACSQLPPPKEEPMKWISVSGGTSHDTLAAIFDETLKYTAGDPSSATGDAMQADLLAKYLKKMLPNTQESGQLLRAILRMGQHVERMQTRVVEENANQGSAAQSRRAKGGTNSSKLKHLTDEQFKRLASLYTEQIEAGVGRDAAATRARSVFARENNSVLDVCPATIWRAVESRDNS